MPITANKAKTRELIKAKRYKATLIGIYDLGHRTGQYGPYHQLVFSYELHDRKGVCKDASGEPLVISDFLDVVLTKKGKASPLAMHLSALLGKQVNEETFAIDDSLLEKGVELTVVHEPNSKGEIRDKIGTVIALEEDDKAPEPVSDATFYEIPRDPKSKAKVPPATSQHLPKELPEWVQNQIKNSLEFGGKGGVKPDKPQAPRAEDGDDDSDPPY